MTTFSKIESALNDLREGKMIILFDHKKRENEGDLVIAAEKVTPAAVNFMATHARGLICTALDENIIKRLGLPLVQGSQRNPFGTAFTISVEAASGVTTGISAADRAHTIRVLINPHSTPRDLVSPGHTFPLMAAKGGVLKRSGQTEGGVDLARLAGLQPAAVICEIINTDGTMARMPELKKFALEHQLALISVQDVINYRRYHEELVTPSTSTNLPTAHYGELQLTVFDALFEELHPLSITKPSFDPSQPVLVRLHSECFTGDLLGSQRCDCGWQMDQSLARIAQEGGILIYLRQEGRGIGLLNKLKAYALQDAGLDTVEANQKLGFGSDERDYWIGAQILKSFNIKRIRLMTNNPQKITDLSYYGIEITERIPLITPSNQHNTHYLATKQTKLGHLLTQ